MIYIVCFVISIGAIWVTEHSKKGVITKIITVVSLILPCLLAALRSPTIGTDYLVYLKPIFEKAINSTSFYEYLNSSWYSVWRYIYVYDWEIGFTSLIYVVAKFTKSIKICAFFVEALVVFPLYKAINNYLIGNKKTIALCIFYFMFFNMSLNNMRQFIAMSFLLLAFSYILSENTNYKKAFISFLVAVLFHKTAFIGLAFYIIYVFITQQLKKKVKREALFTKKDHTKKLRKMIFIGIAAILTVYVVLNVPFVKGLFSNYGWYLSGTSKIMINQLILRLPVIFTYCICWKRQQTSDKYFFGAILFVELVLSQLAGMSSQTIRITYYCSYFYIFSIPYFLNYVHKKRNTGKLLMFTMELYFVIYWIYMYVISGAGSTFPYMFY